MLAGILQVNAARNAMLYVKDLPAVDDASGTAAALPHSLGPNAGLAARVSNDLSLQALAHSGRPA